MVVMIVGMSPPLPEGPSWLSEKIDGEHLQQEGGPYRRREGELHLAIPFRMQGIAMVICVAQGIVKRVPPA